LPSIITRLRGLEKRLRKLKKDNINQKLLLKEIIILLEVGKEYYTSLDIAIDFLSKIIEEYLIDNNNKLNTLYDIFFYKVVKLNRKRVQL